MNLEFYSILILNLEFYSILEPDPEPKLEPEPEPEPEPQRIEEDDDVEGIGDVIINPSLKVSSSIEPRLFRHCEIECGIKSC